MRMSSLKWPVKQILTSLIRYLYIHIYIHIWASQVAPVVRIHLPVKQIKRHGLIPGSGRSPGGGHGNPLQYSCLENPYGQRSLGGYSSRGHTESDMTEATQYAHTHQYQLASQEVTAHCSLKDTNTQKATKGILIKTIKQ